MMLKDIKVLYVEDEYDVRENIAELLKDEVGEVQTAQNGLEAIEILKKHTPDVVLTDIYMPQLNGLELSEHIRVNYENLPVVFLSAFSNVEDMRKAIELGIDSYINKPVTDFNVLRKALEKTVLKQRVRIEHLEEQVRLRSKELDEKNKELYLQSKELEVLFFNAPIPYIVVDAEFQMIKVNHEARRYFDITEGKSQELHKLSNYVDKKERERFDKWICNAKYLNGPIRLEFSSLDDSWVNIFEVSAQICSWDSRLMIVALKNIQNEVDLEHQVMKNAAERHKAKILEQKANVANVAKSNFLASMSHEIRTPMTGLLGFVERLAKDEEDPERLKQFATIKTSGESLLHIINDILDFSKIESGKMEIDNFPFLLQGMLENIVKIFEYPASLKHIHIITSGVESIPVSIYGDSVRIKQVISNLLSNAIKFSSEGATVTLQTKYIQERKVLCIAVLDTGIGIAQDKLDTIFEAFSQEDTSTTRRFGGTGLGLSISSKIISLMGGELQVESEIGKGSKFFFEIPVEICCTQNEIDRLCSTQAKTDEEELHFDADVLVVEDNKTNQMLMGMILDDLGIRYDVANDGVEALKFFVEKNYDIILMDENMPNMNGIEATEQIRFIEKDDQKNATPIVAVTANALVKDRERFLEAGMDDYVSKPYGEKDIVRVLKKYL